MNQIQKQLLVLGAAAMLLMLICPPWTRTTRQIVLGVGRNQAAMQIESQVFAGYSLLWEPPEAKKLVQMPNYAAPGDYNETVSIALDRFLLQWLTVAFLTGAGLLVFKGSDKQYKAEGGQKLHYSQLSKPLPKDPEIQASLPVKGRSAIAHTVASNDGASWTHVRQRVGTAFGFGAFVGMAGAYRVQTAFSSEERVLFVLVLGVVCGLLSAGVIYCALLFWTTNEQANVRLETPPPKTNKKTQHRIWLGIIAFCGFLWLLSIIPQSDKSHQPSGETDQDQSETNPPTPDAQANAEFEREFFERYPDLRPHRAVVDAVALRLAAAGYKGASREEVMEAYAREARRDLARRSPNTEP